jgi:uncharacterized protein YndB with AHSA1/START domain/uncharacterized protein YciI
MGLVLVLAGAAPVASTSAAPSVVRGAVTVQTLAKPKALLFDVDIPAPAGEVWSALTTADGLKTWLTPDAKVDLRPGGDWLAIFAGAAPGGGKVVRFQKDRELVLRAMAPERFATVRRVGTNATFTLNETGPGNTHLQLRQDDWQSGEEWDAAFDYLSVGNTMLLNSLRQRFIKGPQDWARAMREWKAAEGAPAPPRGTDIPRNLTRYFVVFLLEGADRTQPEQEVAEIQKRHLAYIRQQTEAGVYTLAGPFLDGGSVKGVLVVKAGSEADCREIVAADPAVKAGRLALEIHPAFLPRMEAAAEY